MSLVKHPHILRMAPPGSHVVKRHARVSENGVQYYVKAHIRKNRGKKAILLPENLLFLYWHGDHNNQLLGTVKGFHEYPELDSVIQFWINVWKEQGLPLPKDFDPFLIKVIIAKESSFRPHIRATTGGSSATGLMQILQSTLYRLQGIPYNNHIEVEDHYLQLKITDLTDSVINIATGIRWLSHKYQSVLKNKRIKDKSLYSTIKYYHSWTPQGEAYANEIFKMYKDSFTNRFLPLR